MTLNPHPIYPAAGRYVLRLHRDALPWPQALAGRIEHVSSGDSIDFASSAELLEWIAGHAAQLAQRASSQGPDPKDNE